MNLQSAKPLFPGTRIKLEDGIDLEITVYPLGVKHVKKFTDDIARIVNASQRIKVEKGGDQKKIAEQFVMGLVPIIMTDALDLVKECTVIEPQGAATFDELPHWVLPGIADAWIQESFGEEKKWRPWVTLIEKTITRVTGKPFSISEIWSKASSQTDTLSTTSSEGSN